jgi:hypothetical protein
MSRIRHELGPPCEEAITNLHAPHSLLAPVHHLLTDARRHHAVVYP